MSNLLQTSDDRIPCISRDFGGVYLAVIEHDREPFRILDLTTSQYVRFDGYYGFGAEGQGAWCRSVTKLALYLAEGRWRIVLKIQSPLKQRPQVTTNSARVDVAWETLDAVWEHMELDVDVTHSPLVLHFQCKANFGLGEDTRDLSFRIHEQAFLANSDSVAYRAAGTSLDFVEQLRSAKTISLFAGEPVADAGQPAAARDSNWLQTSTVHDAYLIGQPTIIGLISAGKLRCLEESTPYQGRMPVVLQACVEFVERHPASISHIDRAVSLCGEWNDNIWHWFTEFLPYAVHFESTGFTGKYVISSNTNFQRPSLELIGIDASRIVCAGSTVVQVGQLVVPRRVDGQRLNALPGLVLGVNARMHAACAPQRKDRRIYIARRHVRKVCNEDEVLQILAGYEFEVVYLEDLSIGAQVKIAAEASCIAGPHGAGITAAMFMKPGGTLIEFFAPTYVNPCMLAVCDVLRHRYLMVTSRIWIGHPYLPELDVLVDIPTLKASLFTAFGR